ncbi:6-bladed beta-propeller [Puteibacter caeruleilacunae]|nr:6-bladed beta-propeller [Puteibacter caeruleilacunae]
MVDLDNKDLFIDDNIIANTTITPLSTSNNCLVGRIEKMVIQDGKIYLQDKQQKSIITFNENGDFIHKLNKHGAGPDEYRNILDFDVNPQTNNIEILDLRKLLVYNTNKLIKTYKVSSKEYPVFNNVMCLGEDKNAIYSFGRETGMLYSKESEDFSMPMPFNYPKYINNVPTGADKFFRNGDIGLYYHGYPYDIYQVSENGFEVKYKWDFGKYNFNAEDFYSKNTSKSLDQSRRLIQMKYVHCLVNVYESKSLLLSTLAFEGKPALIIYDKTSKTIRINKGLLAGMLASFKATFTKDNKLHICLTPQNLKRASERLSFLSSDQQKTIADLDLEANPVILSIKLQENLTKN